MFPSFSVSPRHPLDLEDGEAAKSAGPRPERCFSRLLAALVTPDQTQPGAPCNGKSLHIIYIYINKPYNTWVFMSSTFINNPQKSHPRTATIDTMGSPWAHTCTLRGPPLQPRWIGAIFCTP